MSHHRAGLQILGDNLGEKDIINSSRNLIAKLNSLKGLSLPKALRIVPEAVPSNQSAWITQTKMPNNNNNSTNTQFSEFQEALETWATLILWGYLKISGHRFLCWDMMSSYHFPGRERIFCFHVFISLCPHADTQRPVTTVLSTVSFTSLWNSSLTYLKAGCWTVQSFPQCYFGGWKKTTPAFPFNIISLLDFHQRVKQPRAFSISFHLHTQAIITCINKDDKLRLMKVPKWQNNLIVRNHRRWTLPVYLYKTAIA